MDDLLEERRKDEESKSVTVKRPKDDAVDTYAFAKTKMELGMDFVFRLADSVLPGEQVPAFLCPGLVGDQEELVTSESLLGKPTLLFFYPKDFGPEGEACLKAMAELKVLEVQLVAASTDSVEVHRAWREGREGAEGPPSCWPTGPAKWRGALGCWTPPSTSPSPPSSSWTGMALCRRWRWGPGQTWCSAPLQTLSGRHWRHWRACVT